jgi:hypothetical protein
MGSEVEMGEPHGGHTSAPVGAKPSPVRLVVLLGILAILAGALGYDQLVAKPAAYAANTKLEDEVDKIKAMGFDPKLTPEEKEKVRAERFINPQKVQEILRQKPTWTESHDGHFVEYYCWWGHLPLINKRHYLSVVYFGKEPNLRYNTHHQNTIPPAESLPGYQTVGDGSIPEGIAVVGTMPSPDSGVPDGKTGDGQNKGKGKGKGRAKGLPPPGESFEDPAASPPAEPKEEAPPVKAESQENAAEEGDKSAEGDKPKANSEEAASEKKSDE